MVGCKWPGIKSVKARAEDAINYLWGTQNLIDLGRAVDGCVGWYVAVEDDVCIEEIVPMQECIPGRIGC